MAYICGFKILNQKNRNILRDLKLEIALAILASNESKIQYKYFRSTRVTFSYVIITINIYMTSSITLALPPAGAFSCGWSHLFSL